MNCLILGGAGFLGSHLCDGLIRAGHSIRVFDRLNVTKDNLAHNLNKIEMIEGDFLDEHTHSEIVKDIDIVFHLISTTVPKTSNENPAYDVSTNIVSTIQFLDTARENGVKKVVFFSSGGTVYGMPESVPIREDHSTNPTCSYGIHKLAIEKYLYLYRHLYGLDYTILRISNPYGGRQRPTGIQGVVAAFLDRALHKKTLEIWGDGAVIRDYIYVADVVDAVLTMLRYRGEHRLFNIGSGTGLSLIDVARAIENTVNYPLKLNFSPAGKLHVPVNILDIGRAHRELGWKPVTSFQEGIRKMVSGFKPY
jgi:UDP-glucose 4-epimerase